MKKIFLLLFILFSSAAYAQKVALDPTISPSIFRSTDPITITYDVTGTSLASLSDAWIWVWIPGKNIGVKYNVNPASSNAALTNNAKFTQSVSGGKTKFAITFKPQDFFSSDISTETQLGMLIKGNDWSNGQTTDYIANIWDGTFKVSFVSPASSSVFVHTGDVVNVEAQTPITADFELRINNVLVDTKSALTTYAYSFTVTETSGSGTVEVKATQGAATGIATFQYVIAAASPTAARPAGIIPGVNYNPSDPTRATVCLWAPDKSSVYLQGDFTDWKIKSEFIMNKDGEYFWLEVTGLVPGTEYGYRFLIDQTIYVADPYADKILDPDDQFIPAKTYPGLKQFPTAITSANWYFNRVSVLQTGQTPFNWKSRFTRKPQDKLVIYEVLIRDFFSSGERNYQNLIDTVKYFKRLGINAVELMPVTEFNGNEGWGYNPTFMFAPDKYYGTKNKLKEFIDACHQNDIAVILDIVMNHQDLPSPMALMAYDFTRNLPTPQNKWFNVTATHPFSVFNDFNHESPYTQQYLDSVNAYWLSEYKVDGFRYDLSKGFTQKNSGNDVSAWGTTDPSRIAILKRMMDKVRTHSPDAYMILEHFADNNEELTLANYGFMLWGNMNYAFAQATMGYASGSNVSGVSFKSRGWQVPGLVGYMESHDEERQMAKNLQYGVVLDGYNVKDTLTALVRSRAAATFFLAVPGPKMIWQFGELGYGFSINQCTDGTNNSSCRLAAKPVRWNYRLIPERVSLFNRYRDMIALRKKYPVFSTSDITIEDGESLVKTMILRGSPYVDAPASPDQMNAVVATNLDVKPNSVSITFPHTGSWYEYFSGQVLEVTKSSMATRVDAGGTHVYTDVKLGVVTATEPVRMETHAYPNPTTGIVNLSNTAGINGSTLRIHDSRGQSVRAEWYGEGQLDLRGQPDGLYILRFTSDAGPVTIKVIKSGNLH